MKKMIIVAIAAGFAAGGAWAKPLPMHSQPKAAAHAMHTQQRAATHAMHTQQKATMHAIQTQQKAGAHAMSMQRHVGAEMMHPRPHGGVGGHGPHVAPPPHHAFRPGVPPPNMRGWRRGPAPHPHYRSGWFGDVWYDAYGYPYYGPAVVTPAPVVAPAPVVVRPAPVVVTPAPVVVTPPPPPPPPPVAVPVRHVVY